MTYKAFISYSHAADGKLAPAIQSALHHFAKPWYRMRTMRIFRDKTSLAMTPALWPAIEAALEQSEYFLLLASPAAATSEWVQKEVEWWLEKRGSQSLLLLLTDGELNWDKTHVDFDWTVTTALPAVLQHRYNDEPLWVDLRWAKNVDDLSLRHLQFRGAILDIAAPLLGRPKDELDGEDVRQHKRTKLVASVAVIAIALFGIVAAWQAYVAQQRYLLALSRLLAANALTQLSDQPDRGLLLAVAASTVRDTVEARSSLLTALESSPLVRVLQAGDSAAQSVAFGPGRALISGHANGNLALWHMETPARPAFRVQAPPNAIRAVAFSPDGRTIAAADNQGLIAMWPSEGGAEPIRLLREHEFAVNGLVFSGDGQWLVSIDENAFAIMRSTNSTHPARQKEFEGALLSVDVNPSTSTIAVGSETGTISLWRPETDVVSTFSADDEDVMSVAFSPTGRVLVSGSRNGAVRLWDLGTPRPTLQKSAMVAAELRAVALSPDGKQVAIAHGRTVTLLDAETLQPVRPSLAGHGDLVFTVAFSRDGHMLASGDGSGRLLLWDLVGHRPLQQPADKILSLALSGDGRFIATGSDDRTVRVTELATGKTTTLAGVHQRGVNTVVFTNPEGHQLASVDHDNVIVAWEGVLDGTPRIVTQAGSTVVLTTTFDDKTLIGGDTDGRVSRIGIATGRATPFDRAHDSQVVRLAANGSGRLIASADGDGRVFLWDATTSRWLRELTVPNLLAATSLAFAPDGKTLAVGYDDGPIRLWDTDLPDDQGTLFATAGGDVTTLAFSRDGAWLASGDQHGGLRLWDRAERQQVGPELKGHRASVTGLVFEPRESPTWLISTSEDSTALRWDLDINSWRRRACQRANRNLTPGEQRQYLNGDSSLLVCGSK